MMTLFSGCMRSGEERHHATDSHEEELSDGSLEGLAPADITEDAWRRADSILATMTLEEKVGQCFMPTVFARVDDLTSAKLERYIDTLHVGGIVLLKGNLHDAAEMARKASMGKVPLFTAIDAEWGLGMRLADAPRFPRNGKLSPDADERLLFDYGREVARECRDIGINMVLGPVVDVVENPRGVIGNRSYGSDPQRVADLGVAYARGVESGGVLSVAKHFPGHGSPVADSHSSLPVISRSLHHLDSVDIYPFRTYIEAGLSGIMVGHLAVPAIDPEGLPAAVSPVVIRKLLREELGFDGLVLTDALNMGGAKGFSAKDALMAGADIIIGPADTAGEIREVLEAVRAVDNGQSGVLMKKENEGEPAKPTAKRCLTETGPAERCLTEQDINNTCRRILFFKVIRGLSPVSAAFAESLPEELESSASLLRKKLGL